MRSVKAFGSFTQAGNRPQRNSAKPRSAVDASAPRDRLGRGDVVARRKIRQVAIVEQPADRSGADLMAKRPHMR